MNNDFEEKELWEMENMLKEIEASMPVPEKDMREKILNESKEQWHKKSFPVKYFIGWAAVVAFAFLINYSLKSDNPSQDSSGGETVEKEALTEEEYNELKKAVDKTLKGKR